jgi:hypothetical protein
MVEANAAGRDQDNDDSSDELDFYDALENI